MFEFKIGSWKIIIKKFDYTNDQHPNNETRDITKRFKISEKIVQHYRSLDGSTWSSIREDVFKRALSSAIKYR